MRRRTAVTMMLNCTLLAFAVAGRGAERWVAGEHYFLIQPAPPPPRSDGKIQITEVFSYACPGCNRFYPVAARLRARLPAYADRDFLGASVRPDADWAPFPRAYCTARAFGIDQRTHDAMFDAIWKTGELAVYDERTQRPKVPAPTIPDIARFYARLTGIKPEEFIATAVSFAIDVKMRQADDLIRAYGVGETPSIVVNGKYRLNPVSAGGYDETIALVQWLVAKEASDIKASRGK